MSAAEVQRLPPPGQARWAADVKKVGVMGGFSAEVQRLPPPTQVRWAADVKKGGMMGKVGGRQEAHQSGDAPGVPGLLRGGGFFVDMASAGVA